MKTNTGVGKTIRRPAPAGQTTRNMPCQTGVGETTSLFPVNIPIQIAAIQIAIALSRCTAPQEARKGLLDKDIPAATAASENSTIQIVIAPNRTNIRTRGMPLQQKTGLIQPRRCNPAAGTAGKGGVNFHG